MEIGIGQPHVIAAATRIDPAHPCMGLVDSNVIDPQANATVDMKNMANGRPVHHDIVVAQSSDQCRPTPDSRSVDEHVVVPYPASDAKRSAHSDVWCRLRHLRGRPRPSCRVVTLLIRSWRIWDTHHVRRTKLDSV